MTKRDVLNLRKRG